MTEGRQRPGEDLDSVVRNKNDTEQLAKIRFSNLLQQGIEYRVLFCSFYLCEALDQSDFGLAIFKEIIYQNTFPLLKGSLFTRTVELR